MESDSSRARIRPIFDPFDAELIVDPYTRYDMLRATEPVHWSPQIQSWVISGYENIRSILEDSSFEAVNPSMVLAELARKAGRDYGAIIKFLDAVLFFKNGKAHQSYRTLLIKVLCSVPFSDIEKFATDVGSTILEAISSRSRYDLVGELTDVLPLSVMAHLLGLPPGDVPVLSELTKDATMVLDTVPLREYDRINRNVAAALELIASRLPNNANDCNQRKGLGIILEGTSGQGGSRREDAAAMALFVFRVGAETTSGLIGLSIRMLLNDPALYRMAREETSLVTNIVTEAIRLESGVQRLGRISRETRVFGDQTIRAGERVLLLLGAGNRDPAVFQSPEDPNLKRPRMADLSFGGGKHFCLGKSIALMEASIGLKCFLSLPQLERDGDERWYPNRPIRRLTQLPVRVAHVALHE